MVSILSARGKADMILPFYPILPGKSAFRKQVSKLWTALVNTLSGHRIRYYNGCGLYLRYHVMRWAPYNYGFGFQADLITLLLDEGATNLQMPVDGAHVDKGLKGSPLHAQNFFSTGHTLFRIAARRLRSILFAPDRLQLTSQQLAK